ncbi:hypothetical protein CWE23_00355 [Idiomarina aquatica]|uniref:DUF2939 family protein n=2 Tax=Idiomarina aquatica TaxID=1327752 RepID=A0AA94JDY0_9GAMM|nr:hypothetical protein CWE23_00355 [Idiomarina aquatica]
MNKGKLITGLIIAAFLVFQAVSPYLTVYQIKSAAESRDSEALSEHIEFSSVRQSLKDQLNAMMASTMEPDETTKGNPFAALGAGIASIMAERIVDAYVTPAGIAKLMAGEKLDADNTENQQRNEKTLIDSSMFYESLNKFVVRVKDEQGDEGKFVLRRRGLGWKLTEIVIPMD